MKLRARGVDLSPEKACGFRAPFFAFLLCILEKWQVSVFFGSAFRVKGFGVLGAVAGSCRLCEARRNP